MRHLLLIATLVCPGIAFSLPYENGVISLDGRQFFVGDVPRENRDDDIWFSMRQSSWLDQFVRSDNILADQHVEFLNTGFPANQMVHRLVHNPISGVSPYVETDTRYTAEGFTVYTRKAGQLGLEPVNSDLKFSVGCTLNSEDGPFSLCRVIVAYPYASHIALTANEFFPGPLSEIAHDFEPIAKRMIEIAICLDVTERRNSEDQYDVWALPAENPELRDCRIVLTS